MSKLSTNKIAGSSGSFEELNAAFRWNIPDHYNIGVDVSDKWAESDPDRTALIDVYGDGTQQRYSFEELSQKSNQLANALESLGAGRYSDFPDRVAVLLPQCVETALTHIAVFKMGLISLPLFILFGPDALLHRLQDSETKFLVTNSEGIRKLAMIHSQLPALQVVINVDFRPADDAIHAVGKTGFTEFHFHTLCQQHSKVYKPKKTEASDPALIIYTSGTTGNPKGALHAHRVLLGHLPGVEVSHNFLPFKDDCFWTPADWAWIGGLLDVLLPSLHHGIPVVAYRSSRFDPQEAIDLIQRLKIRNVFFPPTALKLMKALPINVFDGLKLRSVASGGETLGAELLAWGRRAFGTTINEFYGQTECNMIVSSCSAIEAATPGSMGRAVPGHRVAIINPESGQTLGHGEEGAIAVLSPDPVMFIEYWRNPEATLQKFSQGEEGQWLLTGDRAISDSDGIIRFVGRDDDVITSSGYRIGPGEIENCLVAHESVQMAGVVGKPDAVRGEIVVAFVKLNTDYEASEELSLALTQWVRQRLSAHEYPRKITFLEEMPMTTTGKRLKPS